MVCTPSGAGQAPVALWSTLPHDLPGHTRRWGLVCSILVSRHPPTRLTAAIFATRLKCPSPAPRLCQPLAPPLWDPEARKGHNVHQQPATEDLFPKQSQTCLCGSAKLLCGTPLTFSYTLWHTTMAIRSQCLSLSHQGPRTWSLCTEADDITRVTWTRFSSIRKSFISPQSP